MSSTKYGAIVRCSAAPTCPRTTIGFLAAASAACRVTNPSFGHPRQHVVVAARERALGVDERAQARRRLDDRGDRRRLVERDVLGGFVEIHPRARLDAIGAVERYLIGVQGEDLAFGVAALDLDREHASLIFRSSPSRRGARVDPPRACTPPAETVAARAAA
jgi:hypothetical protein